MDDPWGSPWADEIQHPIVATKLDTQGNDGRPKTPVKGPNLGLDIKADSPWKDDDDGFGEWAMMPVEEEVKGNGLGFDGASDWEPPETKDSRSTTKSDLDGLRKGWNDHMPLPDDTIPSLAPSLMPNSSDILRQHSPDPWATETTLNKEKHTQHTPEVERIKS